MNQKLIVALIASAVIINLVIAIGEVHGQNYTSSIEKEAQEQKERLALAEKYQKEPCLLYYNAHLVIIDLTCTHQQDSIASYLAQGYEIKSTWQNSMYLTK